MFIKSKMINNADFYVKLVDSDFLNLSKLNGVKIILTEKFDKKTNISTIKIYQYKYEPTKDFKGPIVVANAENYRVVIEYVKKHPNRVFAIIADFNSFIADSISHLNFIRSLSKVYSLPLLYGSGAKSSHDFVPPLVLKYALEFFYGEKNAENKKLYKYFFNSFESLVGDERYFEKV